MFSYRITEKLEKFGMDCCKSIIQILLVILNVIFLIIGLAVFILAAILHWSSSTLLGVFDNEDINTFIDLSSVDIVAIVLIIIGAFIILLSIAGLIGACCSNRFFLVVYEIVIIVIFLAHLIVLIVGAVKIDVVEDFYRKTLNTTMQHLNDPNFQDQAEITSICAAYEFLSQTFTCCGDNGPDDFKLNSTFKTQCCYQETYTLNIGCGDKSWDTLKDGVVSFLIIPNAVILGFELIIIVIVPILIRRINKSKTRRDDYVPSTYYKK